MTAVLKITDGTVAGTIDLLSLPGFQLESWRPQVSGYKGDGTYQSSPLAPGRQLVNKQFANTTETFSFKAQDVNQDSLIRDVQDLVRLLEEATSYWTADWQDTPVYLEAKATDETNTRYGHIMSYRIPELENPYNQPFLQPGCDSVMDNLTLIVEHTACTENVPGTGTAVAISAVETYDGRNLGNVDSTETRDPTTANEVYIGNRRNEVNITHIFTWSAANGFSANLMDAGLPYDLIDDVGAAPQVNDYVIFGIEDAAAENRVFSSLVFDIGTAQTGLQLVWETVPGVIVVQDNTDADGAMTGEPFDTAGVNSVHFSQTNIQSSVVNGVTMRWVRARITAVPGPVVVPTQQNRDVYAIIWPYTELQANVTGGDIVSLAKILFQRQDSVASSNDTIRNIIIGIRSSSRGEDFTAYLNCGDTQNPTNISTAVGAATAFISDQQSPSGRTANYGPAAAIEAMATRVTVTIASPLTVDYYGSFHGYLRLSVVAGGTNFNVQVVTTSSSGGTSTTSPASIPPLENNYIIDLGKITLPLAPLSTSDVVDEIEFAVQAEHLTADAGDDIYFEDLILIPVDEWSNESFDPTVSATSDLEWNEILNVDSIEYPKKDIRSYIENSAGNVISLWGNISNGKAIIQANAKQRLWVMFFDSDASTANIALAATIRIEKNQQYITMRGDR